MLSGSEKKGGVNENLLTHDFSLLPLKGGRGKWKRGRKEKI